MIGLKRSDLSANRTVSYRSELLPNESRGALDFQPANVSAREHVAGFPGRDRNCRGAEDSGGEMLPCSATRKTGTRNKTDSRSIATWNSPPGIAHGCTIGWLSPVPHSWSVLESFRTARRSTPIQQLFSGVVAGLDNELRVQTTEQQKSQECQHGDAFARADAQIDG